MFEPRHLPASPLFILLHSWDWSWSRRFLFDVAVNIAAYVPLGMSANLAVRRFHSRTLEIVFPIALGTVLSASLEMAQLFVPTRVCSATDFVDNVAGACLGLIFALVFARGFTWSRERGPIIRDKASAALLVCWAGALLFPLIPLLNVRGLRERLVTFVYAPIAPIPIALSAAEWFAVGHLLALARAPMPGKRSPAKWLVAMLLLVPVQIGIVDRSPSIADLLGAVLGVAVFYFFGAGTRARAAAAFALIAAVTVRGLSPFYFEESHIHFSWIPFIGFLTMTWQNAIPLLLQKVFQYGASIWLLRNSGFGIVRVTLAVSLVLAVIEALQTRIPGHVPESTDPLLAIALGAILTTLSAD